MINDDDKLFTAVDESLAEDLLNLEACSDEEIARRLQQDGIDYEALSARGVAFVAGLVRKQRLSWQDAARSRLVGFKERTASRVTDLSSMSRDMLVDALRLARQDPVHGGMISTVFRKRSTEESTDEDLRDLLQDYYAVQAMSDDEEGSGA